MSTTPEIQMPFPLHFPFGGTLSTVWSPLSSTPWPPNIDCQEHGNSTNQKEGTNCKNQKRLLNVKCEIHGRRSRTSIIDSTTWNSSSSSNGSRRQLQNCTVGNGFVQRKPQYTHTHTHSSTKGRQLISCVRTSTDTSTIATTAAAASAGRQLD